MSEAVAYMPVAVDTLAAEDKVDFDLYLQLNTKYVLYLRRGGIFDNSRLEKMREKKVRNFFIHNNDEPLYRTHMERKLEIAYDANSAQPLADRAKVIHTVQQANAEALFRNPADMLAYMRGRDGARRFTDFILRDENALRAIVNVPNSEKSIAHHGVSVAALSLALAKRMGLGDAKDLHLLAMGALIHDCGLYAKGIDCAKPVADLSPEEKLIYQQHPMHGVREAQELVHYDQHVLKIILEHEEHIDGTGFPKKLREKDMHPYSVIVATADAFDHLVMEMGESALQAVLKRFVIEKLARHPLDQINALKQIATSLK